ncbi:tetratricopeptide repeat protein 27-like [Rhodnius prolixus]|uniref:Uncharacterized protein n=1 Tax=Rhodnius prolixus TaxID=13249 RepID=A0A4P6D7C8_RHOPR
MVYKPSQMWTNLAQIQVIFDERDEALRVMLEASQINPQFWEVWRDLAAMSLSCHKFDIFIKSYSRLLDLNSKYLNVDLLTNLAYSVINLKKDGINEAKATQLIQNVQQLFARVSELQPNNPILLSLKALVASISLQDTSEAFKLMDKALITADLNSVWYRYHSQVMKKIHETKVIINAVLEINLILNETRLSCKLLRSAKSHLKKVIWTLHKYFTDIIRGDLRRDIQEEVKDLETKFATIQQMVPN